MANRITTTLGPPGAIAAVVTGVALWAPCLCRDRPCIRSRPSPDLALVLGFAAVVVALLILSTQRHGRNAPSVGRS